MSQSHFTAAQSMRPARARTSRLDLLLRKRVLMRLVGLKQAGLVIHDPVGTTRLGRPGADLQAEVEVSDMRFWRLMATGGSVGAAESYMAGLWDSPTWWPWFGCWHAIAMPCRNLMKVGRACPVAARDCGTPSTATVLSGSRRNISAHYDLGNDFFATWLDQRMMYSSACT
jgi:cyclopropane-fatty-acyl-phospholipid synthase